MVNVHQQEICIISIFMALCIMYCIYVYTCIVAYFMYYVCIYVYTYYYTLVHVFDSYAACSHMRCFVTHCLQVFTFNGLYCVNMTVDLNVFWNAVERNAEPYVVEF